MTPTKDAQDKWLRALRKARAGEESHAWLDRLIREAGYALPVAPGQVIDRSGEPWVSCTKAAEALGCTDRVLRKYCRPRRGLQPLPHRIQGRRILVQVSTAYEFLARHTKRIEGLRRPSSGTVAPADSGGTGETSIDPHELLQEILDSRSGAGDLCNDDVRTIAKVAAELRIKRKEDAAIARKIDPERVVQMLREVSGAYVSACRDAAGPKAEALLAHVEEIYGVRLSEKNIAAAQLLTRWELEQCNAIIGAVVAKAEALTRGLTSE